MVIAVAYLKNLSVQHYGDFKRVNYNGYTGEFPSENVRGKWMEVNVLSGDPKCEEGMAVVDPVNGHFDDNLEGITVDCEDLELIW